MLSTATLLPLLALSSATLAQSTVQKLFLPAAANDDTWVGSVVNVAADQTTYAIACASGTFSCLTGSTVTLTEGPTNFDIFSQTVTEGITASVSETCTIAGTTSATCVAAVSYDVGGQSTGLVTTTTLGTAGFNYQAVTITAGVSMLGASAAMTTASGNAAMTSTSGNAAMTSASGNAAMTSASGNAAMTSASGNAAAPMVTGMGVMGVVGMGIVALL